MCVYLDMYTSSYSYLKWEESEYDESVSECLCILSMETYIHIHMVYPFTNKLLTPYTYMVYPFRNYFLTPYTYGVSIQKQLSDTLNIYGVSIQKLLCDTPHSLDILSMKTYIYIYMMCPLRNDFLTPYTYMVYPFRNNFLTPRTLLIS